MTDEEIENEVGKLLGEMGFERTAPDAFPVPDGCFGIVLHLEFARSNCLGCIYEYSIEAIAGRMFGLYIFEMLGSLRLAGQPRSLQVKDFRMEIKIASDVLDLKMRLLGGIASIQESLGVCCLSENIRKLMP